jgi:hypothetical protein
MASFDIKGVSVAIMMPTHRDVPMGMVLSMLATLDLLREKKVSHRLEFQIDNSVIVSRNIAAKHFLESGFTKLLFIDSDMTWDAADVLRLVALSTVMPIVAGAYAERQETGRVFIGLEGEPRFNEYGCVPITGCGLGFTIIDRAVIEKLGAAARVVDFGGVLAPLVFHDYAPDGAGYMGEDFSFFHHARQAGFPVHLDPNISLGHVGVHTYRTDVVGLLKAKAA